MTRVRNTLYAIRIGSFICLNSLKEPSYMPPAIEIEHLSKSYPKRNSAPVKAVDDLQLVVPAGQVIGFLGANGAGKTTTIKMLCGLITPDAGHARLNGYAVAHERSAAMHQIGAVLEGTRNI